MIRKKVLSLLLITVIIFGTLYAGAGAFSVGNEYFVDYASGSDDNTGAQDAPFKSVKKAKEMLGNNAGTVHINDGEYFLDSPLYWSESTNGQTYIAEGNDVVITGGKKISSGWSEDTLNGVSCLSIALDDIPEQIMLFGRTGPLSNSRLPDSGYFYLKDGADAQSDSGTFAMNKSVITKAEDTSGLGKSGQLFGAKARAFIRVYHYWMEELLIIDSFDKGSGKLSFCQNFGIPHTMCTSKSGDPYCLENVIAGFNKPGEWYMDYSACKLYYIPREGESKDSTEVWLATTEQLININGAENISFKGIHFKNTNAVYTSNYSQSAYASKSAITVINSKGIVFENCKFINMGESGINFGDWGNGNIKNVSDCSVSGCIFDQIGASAIITAGPNNDSLCPQNITITDNVIMNYGKNRNQACGIFATFCNNIKITHNEIHNGMYTGISCGWSWGYNQTCNHNNDISYNLIYNIGHGPMSDMGGIYVLGIQKDSTMNNNVVCNVCAGEDATTYGGWGLYTDEGSQGWTIENNIAFDNGSQGFHQHYGYHNMVRNNIFAFNEEGQVRSSAQWVSTDVTGNKDTSGENKCYSKQTTDGDQFYLYNDILIGSNQPMYHNYNDNFFTDDSCIYWDYILGENVISEGSKTKKNRIAKSGNSNNYGSGKFIDPHFVDPENRNFRFYDSVSYSQIDFKEIDISTVGSESFCSAYMLNNLSMPKGYYNNELWETWEKAKDAATATRNEQTSDALKKAYLALCCFDELKEYCIDTGRYCTGNEYEAYNAACLEIAKEYEQTGSISQASADMLRACRSTLCERTYTITLNAGEGKVSLGKITYSYSDGENVELPTPSNNDYSMIFNGWERSTDGKIIPAGSYKAGAGDYTLTAKYEKTNNIFKIIGNFFKMIFEKIKYFFSELFNKA